MSPPSQKITHTHTYTHASLTSIPLPKDPDTYVLLCINHRHAGKTRLHRNATDVHDVNVQHLPLFGSFWKGHGESLHCHRNIPMKLTRVWANGCYCTENLKTTGFFTVSRKARIGSGVQQLRWCSHQYFFFWSEIVLLQCTVYFKKRKKKVQSWYHKYMQ